jgi:hypothetical protein
MASGVRPTPKRPSTASASRVAFQCAAGPDLGESLLQEGPHLLGGARWVAGSGAVGQALAATSFPAVEVPTDAGSAMPGVGRAIRSTLSPRFERRNTWARRRALGLRRGSCSISGGLVCCSGSNRMKRGAGISQVYLGRT